MVLLFLLLNTAGILSSGILSSPLSLLLGFCPPPSVYYWDFVLPPQFTTGILSSPLSLLLGFCPPPSVYYWDFVLPPQFTTGILSSPLSFVLPPQFTTGILSSPLSLLLGFCPPLSVYYYWDFVLPPQFTTGILSSPLSLLLGFCPPPSVYYWDFVLPPQPASHLGRPLYIASPSVLSVPPGPCFGGCISDLLLGFCPPLSVYYWDFVRWDSVRTSPPPSKSQRLDR